MKTNLDPKSGVLTAIVPGNLVSTTAESLRAEIGPLLRGPANPPDGWKLFRLELAAASMVDSVGLNFIITILKAVQERGAKMQILYTNQNVHRTFLFTRLDKHIELIKL